MKNKRILALAIVAGISVSCNKGTPVIVTPPATSTGDVVGKITVGYQGWFNAPADGSPYSDQWRHTNLEMWPDTREYTKLYDKVQFAQEGNDAPPFTGNLGNGQPAGMFSSYDQSTVSLHFKWMEQYGIDCAALQRFANEITPGTPDKANRDAIAQHVRTAAEAYHRKFYIMYDASGWGDLNELKTDWTNTIAGSLNLLSSTAYAKQNNKPVVCIYGLAYDGHPATPAKALDLVNWFKSKGCYVIGSLPGEWRKGNGDAAPGYTNFYKALNMISAWAVGRITDDTYLPWVEGDRDFCIANHIDYQPCIYPGTAFHNSNGSESPKNGIPREHGDFLWAQFATLKKAGVRSAYVAMFDELNEATSIFKVAEDSSMIPKGQYFLTLNADGTHVSSDFYLRLVQDGAKMLNGSAPYTTKEPTPFLASK